MKIFPTNASIPSKAVTVDVATAALAVQSATSLVNEADAIAALTFESLKVSAAGVILCVFICHMMPPTG